MIDIVESNDAIALIKRQAGVGNLGVKMLTTTDQQEKPNETWKRCKNGWLSHASVSGDPDKHRSEEQAKTGKQRKG